MTRPRVKSCWRRGVILRLFGPTFRAGGRVFSASQSACRLRRGRWGLGRKPADSGSGRNARRLHRWFHRGSRSQRRKNHVRRGGTQNGVGGLFTKSVSRRLGRARPRRGSTIYRFRRVAGRLDLAFAPPAASVIGASNKTGTGTASYRASPRFVRDDTVTSPSDNRDVLGSGEIACHPQWPGKPRNLIHRLRRVYCGQ